MKAAPVAAAAPGAPQQNMAQNQQAAPAAPKAPATQAAQMPGKPAPVQGQALGQVKQDPGLDLTLPGVGGVTVDGSGVTLDAATAAATAGELEDNLLRAEAAADAAGEALEGDGVCTDDFCGVIAKIIDAVDDTATKEKIFEIIDRENPCGVDVNCVITGFVEEDIPLPEEPEIFVPFVEPEDLPSDEPELDIVIDLAEEEEPCVCDITEGDIEKVEEIIEDSFVEPVIVEVDGDSGTIEVTDEVTDEVIDMFPVDVTIDVIDIIDEKEEAESDGEEVEDVFVIDEVQEIMEEATDEKAEEGIPPNELAEDECCGCCCGCCCDDDDHHM